MNTGPAAIGLDHAPRRTAAALALLLSLVGVAVLGAAVMLVIGRPPVWQLGIGCCVLVLAGLVALVTYVLVIPSGS